jgi:hypothetical protein
MSQNAEDPEFGPGVREAVAQGAAGLVWLSAGRGYFSFMMLRVPRPLGMVGGVFGAIVAGFAVLTLGSIVYWEVGSPCREEIISEAFSADQRYRAVRSYFNCYATTSGFRSLTLERVWPIGSLGRLAFRLGRKVGILPYDWGRRAGRKRPPCPRLLPLVGR